MSLTGPRRSARLAHRAIVSKSCVRRGDTDRNADSPQLKEMAGVNCISKKFRTIACSSRGKTKSTLPFLPEGIIFSILVFLPAEILYNVMRCVCREWYNIINNPAFIKSHLQKSTNGLLIQRSDHPEIIHFVEINNHNVRVTKLRYEFSDCIRASCDGLVLFHHDRSYETTDLLFFVANLITKQIVPLPPLFDSNLNDYLSALVYVHSIRSYKVVCIMGEYENNDLACAILTVGTDTTWRLIDIKHIPSANLHLLIYPPLSAGGHLYWTPLKYCSFLLALDVEAEIMHQLPAPKFYNEKGGSFSVKECFLALMVREKKFLFQVWVLTELKIGGWTRHHNIDLTAQSGMLNQMPHHSKCSWNLYPIAWLKNGELVIFRVSAPFRTYICYNVKTREVTPFIMGKTDKERMNIYHTHVNSLVSLKVR